MLFLGVDPGSADTGFGVISVDRGALEIVDHGVVRANSKCPLPKRLEVIYSGIKKIIDQHQPNGVAVEAIFYARNPRSSLILGQARGVILLAAVHGGLEVFEYSPRQVKQAVTGYGHAGKEQIRAMVRSLLAIEEMPSLDASDALAVAICHAHCQRMRQQMGMSP